MHSGWRVDMVVWGPAGLLLVTSLALWQWAVMITHTPAWLLPGPVEVAHAAFVARQSLFAAAEVTGTETVLGFGLAVGGGFLTGVAIFWLAPLRRALYPWLVVSQTLPVVAVAPLLAVWLGFGLLPKLIVVFLMAFFPVTVTTADALRRTDPDLVRLMRSFGSRDGPVLWHVRLPAALPDVFSGMRLAAAYAVVGAVVAEWTGSSQGLGYTILRASSQFDAADSFAAIAVASIMGIALFGTVSLIERLVIRWPTGTGWREPFHERA